MKKKAPTSAIHGHEDDFLYKEGEHTATIGRSMISAIDDVLYAEWKRTAQEGSPMSAIHGHDDDFVYELENLLKRKRRDH